MNKHQIYYSIAGHNVCIECDNPKVMAALGGFGIFRTPVNGTADLRIILSDSVPQRSSGKLYRTLVTENSTSRFYAIDTGLDMEIDCQSCLQLSLMIDKINKICMIQGNLVPSLLQFALWMAFNVVLIHSQTVAIHASAIMYKEQAFLFLGESGTGKSTHARLICQNYPEAEILNDDSPILKMEEGTIMVYGSPWSGKTPFYKTHKAPLGTIVRLHQAAKNSIIPLPMHQAVGALLPSFPPELYLCHHFQYEVVSIISDIIENRTIYSLNCLPNKEAASLSIETITKTFYENENS